ncbi:hypothetical protein I317_03618 [Kwoniella heveanensis CBS 569]|uniref:Zn(2)-C6 fungal-type domain-containing protein n=1 Tax=Kwoniella heveanensis BCC8398 TaxID=1296120 RepID=A0A1B9GU06_9TREE|nr:hypothetical protein I316_03585 [Kwoniella heveanensis BCC8398]OCF42502.1 hypothetical protein I317_03618 [Kwoniella heveanensis CBS 569]
MPSKRRSTDSDDDAGSVQPQSKRQVSHASRACDECRKRKIRCDGADPQCSVCKKRNLRCQYNDEDKRKTNIEHMENLNQRMDRFEKMLSDILKANAPATSNTSALNGLGTSPGNTSNITDASPSQVSAQAGPSRLRANSQITSDIDLFNAAPLPSAHSDFSQSSMAPPDASPVNSNRFRNLEGGHDHDRLQRMEEGSGSLIQYGPTSLWTCASPRPRQASHTTARGMQIGDWVDWSRNLPSSLDITRPIHDLALEYFAANYALWCSVVDMPAFLDDLITCNLIQGVDRGHSSPPIRTAHYSPLLHCCVLYLGLHLIKHEHPGLFIKYENVFLSHCSKLLPLECDQTALSSLRAYGLFSVCAHYNRTSVASIGGDKARFGDRQNATGYLYSGIAVAGVHALGLNLDCQSYVIRGQITEAERHDRISTFWTIYVQDVFRALANGRQPMLPEATSVPLPQIDPVADQVPWKAPSAPLTATQPTMPGMSVHGLRSMRSTSFHWTVKLAIICREILDKLYGPNSRGGRDLDSAGGLLRQLEGWYSQLPLHPADATPLPHTIHLHAQYHLCVIFVLRPYYRSSSPAWASKCDQAAMSILTLLHRLENVHGIQHCHHSFINIIFGAATIFLMRSVDPSDKVRAAADTQRFNECVEMMSKLSSTWSEATMSEYILRALQKEFHVPDPSTPFGATQGLSAPIAPLSDMLGDNPEWWGSMFTDQLYQWSDIINGARGTEDLGF